MKGISLIPLKMDTEPSNGVMEVFMLAAIRMTEERAMVLLLGQMGINTPEVGQVENSMVSVHFSTRQVTSLKRANGKMEKDLIG